MAISRFRKPKADNLGLATFVAEVAAPRATPAASVRPAASDEEIGPALKDMRLVLEDGLLMVFGPEGDPVPPHVFTAAAAARTDARLALPDGAATSAARVAAVLRAQILGRLGGAVRSNDWIMAMLREPGGPEQTSERELRAEEETAGETLPEAG